MWLGDEKSCESACIGTRIYLSQNTRELVLINENISCQLCPAYVMHCELTKLSDGINTYTSGFMGKHERGEMGV